MSVLRILTLILLVGVPSLAWSQSTADRIGELEKQVAALEQKLEAQQAALEKILNEQFGALSKKLDQRFSSLEKKLGEAGGGQAQLAEQSASALLGEINQLTAAAKFEEAKKKMASLQSQYGQTTVARRARTLQAELSVIGKNTPGSLGIEKWYQGHVDVNNGKPTLLVFWEVWCPHCKREVPKLEQVYTKYKDKGLQMVGLTKVTRSATEEQVQDFIKASSLSYPVAKENGDASAYFSVRGIPAAALVKDGKVIWRGHPARLTEQMLQRWL